MCRCGATMHKSQKTKGRVSNPEIWWFDIGACVQICFYTWTCLKDLKMCQRFSWLVHTYTFTKHFLVSPHNALPTGKKDVCEHSFKQMITIQQAFLLSSGGNAVFYKPAGVASEIRSGYLIKSPPSKKMKAEVTDLA